MAGRSDKNGIIEQGAADMLYAMAHDHDRPPRPFPLRRHARGCRSCGSRFVASGPFERLCPPCRKEARASRPVPAPVREEETRT